MSTASLILDHCREFRIREAIFSKSGSVMKWLRHTRP